ncbi:MAG: phytanoyl-CoA dioxygenase family protein [Gammaproteobacteria bacterium]|nr:phytanoyl-CoA dioxygenase family protein [Gammaproteobacteria bacterium]
MDRRAVGECARQKRDAFRADGAVLMDGLLDPPQLAACRSVFDWGFAHPGPFAATLFAGTQHRTHNDNSNPNLVERCHALVKTLPFGDLLCALWGSNNVWYYAEELFAKEGGKAGRSPWHQDTSYLPWAGDHWANAWISFEAIPKRNALEVVRGSQHGTRYDGTTFQNAVDPTDPLHGGDALPRLPNIEAIRKEDPDAFDIVSWATRPGDVLLVHPGALHGGAPVRAECPDRHTLVLRFFGDDATFRSLPSVSRSGFTPAGILHLEHIAHLKDGDPYRSPFFVQLA